MSTQGIVSSFSRVNILILGVYVFFLSTKIMYWLPRDLLTDSLYSWVYTDWLIDYSSGFTRRGLAGGLLSVASIFVHPYILATFLSWLIFAAVVCGYLRLCIRSIDQ